MPLAGLQPDLFKYLKTITGFFAHMLEREVLTAPVIANSQAVHDYLYHSCAALDREQFRVLFLDSTNRLISDQIMAQGSVSRVDVHLRDIVVAALEQKAVAMILVHNHPSGDPAPSEGDIALTRELISLCRSLDITLHEHLIVARSGVIGLRDQGFVP